MVRVEPRWLAAVVLGVAATALAACSSSSEATRTPSSYETQQGITMRTEGASTSAPMEAGQQLRFGDTALIKTDSGSVAVTIAQPKVQVLHAAECCSDKTEDGSYRGKPIGTYVVVTISAQGRSGTVDLASDLSTSWEESDGTLKDESLVLMAFEDINQLTDNPTTLRTGQKTSGQITFESADKAGKFSIGTGFDSDGPAAVWSG